jgi:hypothetical protein
MNVAYGMFNGYGKQNSGFTTTPKCEFSDELPSPPEFVTLFIQDYILRLCSISYTILDASCHMLK